MHEERFLLRKQKLQDPNVPEGSHHGGLTKIPDGLVGNSVTHSSSTADDAGDLRSLDVSI